jgi:uncharacterized protein YfaS (alpha-2-macroglobulin family)
MRAAFRSMLQPSSLMKTLSLWTIAAWFALITSVWAGPRDAQWRAVDAAVEKGLPQTAIEELKPILAAALADQAYAEAIRALGRKIALEADIQGHKAEEKIVRLEAELKSMPEPMKPMLEAILAHWYWQYFQQNRWRFLQRTQSSGTSGPDLQTWDLARILAEIAHHFDAALKDDSTLKSTPVQAYDDVLTKGNVPDAYRPTLFDFIAYEALQFYQSGEQAAVTGEDEFEVEAAGPVFGNLDEFMAWALPKEDSPRVPQLEAVRLYQSLLKFHERDADPSAYLDADLGRLQYGHNVAVGPTKDERYEAALERFIDRVQNHEISSRAMALLASQRYEAGDPVLAREIAFRGFKAFPQSAGAASCSNLIQQIEAPSVQLTTENVWNEPWPSLEVTYRNVTKMYFRAVRLNFNEQLGESRWSFEAFSREHWQRPLSMQPALEWASELPPTSDYKERLERLPAPTSLKPGFYVIMASHDPSFRSDDNHISMTSIWVTDLSLVLRRRSDDAKQSGFVLHAQSGEPVEGAVVRLWQLDREGWFKPVATGTTDPDGRFEINASDRSIVALAEFEGRAVASAGEFHNYAISRHAPPQTQTVFFTDRSIYRPGQTVNYKAVCVRSDQEQGRYGVVAKSRVTVVFNDANGEEIARATHVTNDYGSINGVFTAPRDRTGMMSLETSEHGGETSISVEEYKRPKFQVALAAPTEAAKLDQNVVISGKATAYTGSGINGAKVKWRVERNVQLPAWCWWWQPPALQAIAHGTAVTDADGAFRIEFPAVPDRAVPAETEPVFVFSIHADVTDTTGETRSDHRSVRTGYTALQASLQTDDWQTPDQPVAFALTTSSLDGDPLSAQGILKIHVLQQPATVARAPLSTAGWHRPGALAAPDATNPDSWLPGALIGEYPFQTDATGQTRVSAALVAGIYRASLETTDRFGKKVTAQRTVEVVDPRDRVYRVKLPDHFTARSWSAEPGQTFTALWGTGYGEGRALVELEQDGKTLKRYWTPKNETQALVELPIVESMRGGITVRVTSIKANRAYFNERVVSVPWSNKQLSVKWERFRSKLLPGAKETWTAVVTGPDAKEVSAEMVATLYDASLDAYQEHDWPDAFEVFRSELLRGDSQFQNVVRYFRPVSAWNPPTHLDSSWQYRSFLNELLAYGGFREELLPMAMSLSAQSSRSGSLAGARLRTELRDVGTALSVKGGSLANYSADAETEEGSYAAGAPLRAVPSPNLSTVTTRKNLNETAFFMPQLIAGEDGTVRMEFTVPEALTEWKFFGFAHDQQLRAGLLRDRVVTSKDLMVEPNPPRFVREGDAIEFTVKVTNQSDEPQSGTVRLIFTDAASEASRDEALGNRATEKPFSIPAKQSQSYSWQITVPEGLGVLTFKALAASAKFSDGEEGFLPVLSRRILVTESLPLPVRGKSTPSFALEKLIESGRSDSLRHESLTVQMTSQPGWYAVLALPYLMEYPHDCSEQVFNRLYANALARHIANSDPKIRRVFELWKTTTAVDSPLEKNEDLKAVMLQETPWLRSAKAEGQARRNVGLLFDQNRLDEETAGALRKLADQQLSDGMWPWFAGGRPSEYISLYITTGFGRLRKLGVDIDVTSAVKSLGSLDAWILRNHQTIMQRTAPDEYVLSPLDALYLYGRSFFLSDQPVPDSAKPALEFFLRQARASWVKMNSRQSQAHLALALHRFGDAETAAAIMKSLKERSVNDEELGRYWRDLELSWWWFHAPIETQALMVEAFAEVTNDRAAVEDCKIWLLKQKHTQDWRTTKATADAVYGLLLQGNSLLASDAQVQVSLGGEALKVDNVEAGMGYFERRFAGPEITPEMGRVTVKKIDDGVSWGSIHWQYLENIDRVTPHTGTPLTLKKTLFVKETTKQGQVLRPVTDAVAVGDELVVRLELRADRDMEFVHLKDQRGSGTEPVAVLSQYRYQDGLAYHESTRDTASHFFIDYLPKGVYVFEYSTRVQLRGRYQSGVAAIQCLYAPEFNSHSESVWLDAK